MKVSINLAGEKVTFDRHYTCDFCGERKLVGVCTYGSTNSNRLVCKKCVEEINKYHEEIGDEAND